MGTSRGTPVAEELGSPGMPVAQGVVVHGLPVDDPADGNSTIGTPVIANPIDVAASDTDSDRTTGPRRPSSSPTIAIPVGPYADLGVNIPHAVEPEDTYAPSQRLLNPGWARSDATQMWRDNAEERKIRFLASLSQQQRFRLWWRNTWLGKTLTELPGCPRWVTPLSWCVLLGVCLIYLPIRWDREHATPRHCGVEPGEAPARFTVRRVPQPRSPDHAFSAMHTYLHNIVYAIDDDTSGEKDVIRVHAHNQSAMVVAASESAVRQYGVPRAFRLPVRTSVTAEGFSCKWSGGQGASFIEIQPVFYRNGPEFPTDEQIQHAEQRSDMRLRPPQPQKSNDQQPPPPPPPWHASPPPPAQQQQQQQQQSSAAAGGAQSEAERQASLREVLYEVTTGRRMYVSKTHNAPWLISIERFTPGRIFFSRGAPTAEHPGGRWKAVGEAAAPVFTQPLAYSVCTGYRAERLLALLLTVVASDRMLDNNGVASDTFVTANGQTRDLSTSDDFLYDTYFTGYDQRNRFGVNQW